jgi:hypothetical protein
MGAFEQVVGWERHWGSGFRISWDLYQLTRIHAGILFIIHPFCFNKSRSFYFNGLGETDRSFGMEIVSFCRDES